MPEDHDYDAIRHATWLATDAAYKRAIEDYSDKKASVEDSRGPDRPADFTPSEPVVQLAPLQAITLSLSDWEKTLSSGASLTNRMNRYPQVVDGSFRISANATNRYVVNSEGTRVRHGDVQYQARISVTVQTPEGLRISDEFREISTDPRLLGSQILRKRLENLVEGLTAASEAPLLDGYTHHRLLLDQKEERVC